MTASSASPAAAFDVRQHLAGLLRTALTSVAPAQGMAEILLERPKQASHGDFASNVALQLARDLKTNPRQIAERLVRELPPSPYVTKAEVAGAGFINFTLTPAARTAVVPTVLAAGSAYGRGKARNGKAARRVQIEFVSANPTGPLHVGHGRGAAFGATVANLLEAIGYQVHREYYVNDAGRQIGHYPGRQPLATLSGALRRKVPVSQQRLPGRRMCATLPCSSISSMAAPMWFPSPANLPRPPQDEIRDENGDVVTPGDKEAHIDALVERAGTLLGEPRYRYLFELGLNTILDDIRDDLQQFGVVYDEWYSERALAESGAVNKTLNRLRDAGYVYEQDGAPVVSARHAFGDEKGSGGGAGEWPDDLLRLGHRLSPGKVRAWLRLGDRRLGR